MDTRMTDRARLLVLCSSIAVGAGCGDNAERKEPPPDDPSIVQLADAQFQGTVAQNSRSFLGIPYAKPPVGDLRWKAPQKPDPWPDLRTATEFGKRCAQLGDPALQNAPSTDEDCLYLNVWTPMPVPVAPLPVMVWIHGGGNVNGSASEPVPFVNIGAFYSGQILTENHGVIVVSLNYRLGVFGFFSHPSLTAEGTRGNQGLLDQLMAIQWVHDNIARFGGDPNNVTIFGESAGSFDVCMHVASPLSRGLFHRAISESGGCTTRQRTRQDAETAATVMATKLSCAGTDAQALACLRGKPVMELLNAPSDAAAGAGSGPNVDGTFMTDQPRALYDSGQIAKVPYLLGSNTDEGTLFLTTRPATEVQYKATLNATFCGSATTSCDRAIAVAAQYQMTDFTNDQPNPATAALARVIGDSRLVCTTFDTAQRMTHAGAAVFMYNFDIPVPAAVEALLPPGTHLGATHGSELTSVFGTSPTFAADAQAKGASDLIQRYWTNFAKTGDPNGGADLKWPAFTESMNVRMNLAFQPSVVTNFRADKCAFWQVGYAMQFLAP
jgi:para-nitrobenzyl esterase